MAVDVTGRELAVSLEQPAQGGNVGGYIVEVAPFLDLQEALAGALCLGPGKGSVVRPAVVGVQGYLLHLSASPSRSIDASGVLGQDR